MKSLAAVVVIALVLILGGGLTMQLANSNGSEELIPFFLVQSDQPEASTLQAAPWQAEQLVLFVGFVLINLIGIGATIALIMWFLHRNVKIAEASPNKETTAVTRTTKPERAVEQSS